MINRNLTIESGLTEVGVPVSLFQVVVDSDRHPLAIAQRKFNSLLQQTIERKEVAVIRSGDFFGMGGAIFYDKSGHPVFFEHHKHPSQASNELHDLFLKYFYRAFNTEVYSPLNDTHIHLSILDCIIESFGNAIEHGTGFCTKGSVGLQWITGRTKALITITQTSPGPSRELMDDLTTHPQNYDYGKGYLRGAGMFQLSRNKNVQVNFDFDEGGGFSVILLAPCSPARPEDIELL